MLTSADLMNKIDEIVEKAYLNFTFDLIGDDYFTEEQKREIEALGLIIGRKPLIELLYLIVRQRSTPGYKKDATLSSLLSAVAAAGTLSLINDAHRYSIDHAKQQLSEAIEDTKQQLKKKVKQQILKVNNDYKNEIAVQRITTLPNQAEKKKAGLAEMLTGITVLGIGIHKLFSMAFTTALTNTVNNAAVDEATAKVLTGEVKDPKKIQVYKEVINDDRLCHWCHRFYDSPQGPVVFDLDVLQANGSNDGKPKDAWLPTVGPTHVRCRCQLHFISK